MNQQRLLRYVAGLLLTVSATSCSDVADTDGDGPPTAAPEQTLTVEILPDSGQCDFSKHYYFTVRFRNAGPESVFIFNPLEGSLECEYMPFYRIQPTDANHQPLKPRTRACIIYGPLWANTQWPQDYQVEIKPNSYADISLLFYYDVPPGGRCHVEFEYVYLPKEGDQLAPPSYAWRGSVKAPAIFMTMKPFVNR